MVDEMHYHGVEYVVCRQDITSAYVAVVIPKLLKRFRKREQEEKAVPPPP